MTCRVATAHSGRGPAGGDPGTAPRVSRWAVVVDNGRDENGKRRQKWLSGYRTKGEAEDALVTALGRIQRGETVDPDTTPLADYMRQWLKGRRGPRFSLVSSTFANGPLTRMVMRGF